MRRLLLAWLSLLPLAGCDCSGNGTTPCTRTPDVGGTSPAVEAPFFLGQQAVVTLEVPSAELCDEKSPEVTQVTVEVTDSRNLPVEHFVTPPRRHQLSDTSEVWRVDVAFNPERAGSHHVLVAFEPAGGIAQRDVQIVVDRRGPPLRSVGTPGTDCDAVVFTARGSTLCRVPGGGAVLFRNNLEVQRWANEVQVVGNTLWALFDGFGGGFMTRNVDTGLGPTVLTHQSPNTSTMNDCFTPTESDVAWWTSRGVERYVTADGGALERVSRTDVAEDRYPMALAYAPDAGLALFGVDLKWGRIALAPGNTSFQPAWRDIDSLVAQQPGGLWVQVGSAVQRIDADPRVSEQSFIPPLGWDLRGDALVAGNYDQQPAFFPLGSSGRDFTRALVPVVSGGDAWLEYFEALPGTEFVEVSGGLLRARNSTGEQHYFWRPGP